MLIAGELFHFSEYTKTVQYIANHDIRSVQVNGIDRCYVELRVIAVGSAEIRHTDSANSILYDKY